MRGAGDGQREQQRLVWFACLRLAPRWPMQRRRPPTYDDSFAGTPEGQLQHVGAERCRSSKPSQPTASPTD
jgi:hypothetical protein